MIDARFFPSALVVVKQWYTEDRGDYWQLRKSLAECCEGREYDPVDYNSDHRQQKLLAGQVGLPTFWALLQPVAISGLPRFEPHRPVKTLNIRLA